MTITCADVVEPVNDLIHPYFTDMVAAPNGAPVTVYGPEVTGPIQIGSQLMTNCQTIDETVYIVPQTGRRLAKTTCWIENAPVGVTTIQAGNSGPMPFCINTGTVQTITSHAQLDAAMVNPQPGDVFLLQGFVTDLATDGRVNGGQSTIWMRPGEHNGTAKMPITLLGYPGNPAKFQVSSFSYQNDRALELDNTGWVVANLDFDTVWSSILTSGDHRIVGNRFRSMTGPKRNAGTGSVSVESEDVEAKVLGNIIHGGRSEWRFDHAIYMKGCPDQAGVQCICNYLYDNKFSRGPQISINHQPPRCGDEQNNKALASHFVQWNTVDTTTMRGKAIGINSFGWYSSNPNMPGWTHITDNDLINGGYEGPDDDIHGDARKSWAINISRGAAFIQRNRLYNSNNGILIADFNAADIQGVSINDNQIDNTLGIALDIRPNAVPLVTLSGNVFGPIP